MKREFKDRHKYLGASEIGQALSMSRYGSAYELWEQKTLRAGRPPHQDIFDRGHFMEDAMVEIMKTRYNVTVYDREKEFVSDAREWLVSHVDGLIPQDSPHMGIGAPVAQEGPGVVEFKAPGRHAVETYKNDGIPGYYLLQMHFNMKHAGCKWGVFVIMDYENWDIIPIYMELDEDLVNGCLIFLDEFWECVTSDTPPPHREGPAVPVGPTRKLEGYVMEDSPLAARLAAADLSLKNAKEAFEKAKEDIKRDMVAANTDTAHYISDRGTLVRVTWREGKPRESIDGKKLLAWTENLLDALACKNVSLTEEMAQKFSPLNFIKTSKPIRPFNYTIKED